MGQQLHIPTNGIWYSWVLGFPWDTDLQFSPQLPSETSDSMQHDLGHITEFQLEIIKPNRKHQPARKKSGSYHPCWDAIPKLTFVDVSKQTHIYLIETPHRFVMSKLRPKVLSWGLAGICWAGNHCSFLPPVPLQTVPVPGGFLPRAKKVSRFDCSPFQPPCFW